MGLDEQRCTAECFAFASSCCWPSVSHNVRCCFNEKKKKKERKQWPSAASYLHGLANISWSSSTSFLAVFKSSLMCVETNTRTDVGLGSCRQMHRYNLPSLTPRLVSLGVPSLDCSNVRSFSLAVVIHSVLNASFFSSKKITLLPFPN